MTESRLAELFLELAEHEGRTDVVREILTEKCTDMDSLYELVLAGHHQSINRNALLQFLALESPTAARDLASSVDSFLDLYSANSQLSLAEFQSFVLANRRDPLRKMFTPDRYELRYTLFLLFVKEIENCQKEAYLTASIDMAEALRLLFPSDKQVLTSSKLVKLSKQTGKQMNSNKEELLWRRLGRACRRQDASQITIKEFNNFMRGTPVLQMPPPNLQRKSRSDVPLQSTPTRKQGRSSEKSTALKSSDKKQMKLELEDLSREVKKKVYEVSLSQVTTKKLLAFIIAVCRRDKQINALKSELFGRSLGLAKLFHELDTTGSEFVTAQQLQPFFGDLSDIFAFFYGYEGIIRFSDFTKMLVPVNYSLQELEACAFEEITAEAWGMMAQVLKKMAQAESSNLKELDKLVAQLHLKDRAQLFRSSLFEQGPLSSGDILALLDRNAMIMSELELLLLFRKFDRDCDGSLTLEDFSPYLRG